MTTEAMEFFRRSQPPVEEHDSDFLALEDGRREETRLIGQELVPVAPRRVEVTRTKETVTYEEDAEQRMKGEQQVRDVASGSQKDLEAELQVSSALARPTATTPTLEKTEEDMRTPQMPSGAWPGGPSMATPPVFGPSAGSSQPLFSYSQLKRLQDLHGLAPQLYGPQVLAAEQVSRPGFLEDEEVALRLRLREIEDKKKKESEGSQDLRDMLSKTMQENEYLRQLLAAGSLGKEEFPTPDARRKRDSEYGTPEEERGFEKNDVMNEMMKRRKEEVGGGSRPEDPKDTVAVMLKLMQGMQALQEKIVTGSGKGGADYMETVKAPLELPKLSMWDPESGPIDFNDWLALIQPYMEDLADTATEWWTEMLGHVQRWYDEHMQLTPLARLGHECKAPSSLALRKWTRLERRASAMLMAALPEPIKDEILSSRMVTTFGILCKLYVAYQPGGLAEKSLVLTALENPREETTLAAGVAGLRKWIRWRRRAKDIGVSIPDPTVLLRGLTKLTRKVLGGHADLAFRISLARNTLLLDSVPNHTTVGQFADHLLAELEQLHLQDRKKKEPSAPLVDPKAKEIRGEMEKGKGKGKSKDKGGAKGDRRDAPRGVAGEGDEVPKCRFYLTEQGCRKGRLCDWSHDQTDGRRRCYACGSPEHLAPDCPRSSTTTSPTSSTTRPKIAKAEEEKKPASADDTSETSSVRPTDETMQQLLQEANKMLKGLQEKDKDKQPDLSAEDRMKALQQQLDELKFKSLKTLRLTRITKGGGATGLLDSGATHPMRGYLPGEKVTTYPVIMATLASGKTEPMRISPAGVMVLETVKVDHVEPIVPMGVMMRCLGCRVVWDKDYMKVWHPQRGDLKVKMVGGCPQVSRRLALQLIEEIEESSGLTMASNVKSLCIDKRMQEMAWIRKLVENHPVFEEVPQWIKDKLVALPASDLLQLPANRRVRKLWKKTGCILHLYAGPDEGYTMRRAFKEVGGVGKQVLELDILRSGEHDMLDNNVYPSLLRLALDGDLQAVIGGPNCRTRSVLRSYEGGPPQARAWTDNQEWGKHDASEEDLRKVRDDDELMFKMIMLYLVAKYARKVEQWGESRSTHFLLEQPDAPDYKPEVVSFWWTRQWRALQEAEDLKLLRIQQGDYGGQYVKPTGLGTDLDVKRGTITGKAVGRSAGLCHDTKQLARWTPGLCREIAKALMEALGKEIKLRKMSWQEHLAMGHTPFRRDCRVCQEAAAKDRPHRRVQHPLAGCLSIDITGPLRLSQDQYGEKKYMLIGAFTWVKLKNGLPDAEAETREGEERAVEIEDDGVKFEAEGEEAVEDQDIFDDDQEAPAEHARSPEAGPRDGERGESTEDGRSPGSGPQDGEKKDLTEEEKKALEDFDVETFRLAIALPSRAADVVLEAVIQMYLQLRMDGYNVRQLHSDRAREFTTRNLQRWCLNRGICKTTTAGDSPQQNGRAEKAVQAIKAKMRIALMSCGWDASRWALACQYVHNLERLKMAPSMKRGPTLGTTVLVRKRFWKARELEPTHSKVTYVSPLPEVHGHLVMEEDGTLAVTSYVLSHTVEPPDEEGAWIAVQRQAEDEEDALRVRRRIRGKMAVRALTLEDELQGELTWLQRTRQEEVVADEALRMITDEEDTIPTIVKQVKQRLTIPEVEEEDVLRTRIVSVNEFLQEKDLWRGAIQAEMTQLFDEKKALVRSSLSYVQSLKETGRAVEIIPSKLVITLKPGPKRKMRIVACGNFLEFKGEELFAAGADASALRFTLKIAAEERWRILTVDIKVAFLNAPLVTTTRDQGMVQEDVMFVLKPPSLLIKLGYAQATEAWIAEKAMYGLRQSPRSWSIYRDRVMMDLEIPNIVINQADSEPNLWILRSSLDDTLKGLILVYVDDMLITGSKEITTLVLEKIQKVWQTSIPEEVLDGTSSKFLGMEIARNGEVIRALQTAYVEDRLETNLGGDWRTVKDAWMPCPREIDDTPEEDVQPAHVKEAQRVVGELLWLVTRTRPDLAFTTSRMAQMVLKCPRMVAKMADQVWRYLRTTRREGLSFQPTRGTGWAGESQTGLEAFSDASFAPGGGTSVGAVMIRWNGALMQWRAGRQPFPTLSAAEAELTEATEALVMGDSFDALVSDVYAGYPKTVFVDNMAAINLLTEESGVWRTRHLRLRAHHMRWRINRTDWRVAHCPGSVMIADIGTKPLSAGRLKELKQLMNMLSEQDLAEEEVVAGGSPQLNLDVKEKLLRMIVLAAMMKVGATQPASDEENPEFPEDRTGQSIEEGNTFRLMLLFYTAMIVLATIVVQRFYRLFVEWNQTSVAASMDPEQRRRYLEEERERTYAALQSRIRRADRERRAAEDQLLELEMTETRSSGRRRGGRFRRMASGSADRSRTPSERSTPARSTRWDRYTSEEEYRTEPYASPVRDGDEGSQLGGSADDHQRESEVPMGLWRERGQREERRGRQRGTREDVRDDSRSQGSRERSSRRSTPLEPRGSAARLPLQEEGDGRAMEGDVTPELFSPSPLPELPEEEGQGLQGDGDQVLPELSGGEDRDLHDEDDDTPEDIAGPAHYLEELQDVFEPDQGRHEEGEEESPRQEDPPLPGFSPEPDNEPEGEDGSPEDPDGGGPPNPQGAPSYVPEYNVYVTRGGARYHTSTRCCTLANTRRLLRCRWCDTCARITDLRRYGSVYMADVGAVAHLDTHCPVLNGPPWIHFPHCQRCGTWPWRRPDNQLLQEDDARVEG